MAAIFNQKIYDVNSKRYYVAAKPDTAMPLEVFADLKLSVPNFNSTPVIQSIFINDSAVRMLITDTINGKPIPVVSYIAEGRSVVRIGIPLPLKSLCEGYTGYIVFGQGIANDYTGKFTCAVSEECLTRFCPSCIPYVIRACSNIKASGEVKISGGGVTAVSRIMDSISEFPALSACFPTQDKALVIDVIDTGKETDNPLTTMANGINRVTISDSDRSPVFSIAGVRPDCSGNIRFQFSNKFTAHTITPADNSTDMGIGIALGVNVLQEDICGQAEREMEPGEACPPGTFQLVVSAASPLPEEIPQEEEETMPQEEEIL